MAKILVIEDEFDIRDEVMNWLQFEGYAVVGAENGKLGLEAVRSEQPDLVLCDVSMPEMDGHEVLIELRSDVNYVQLPFVFLTAAADHESMRKGMNLGADDYLTKPFTHLEIINAVRTRLGKQSQIQSQIDNLSSIIDVEREQRLLKSRLVGMFSHDFRNPLASILSASNILQNYSDRMTAEQQQQHFHHIDGAVQLLLQMLDEMLMVAELESEQLSCEPEPMTLTKMLNKIVSDFRLIDNERHQIALTYRLPEFVELDPKLVQHIITNLVSNALKYSPDESEIKIDAALEGEQIVISVQDAGIGIPEEDLSKIFEPFFRADNVHSKKGTGLGLALVQEVVDVCGGAISVSSELDAGSCFIVRLPLSNQ